MPAPDGRRSDLRDSSRCPRPAERLGKTLVILRIATGFTLEEIAAAWGVRNETIRRYEEGELVPGLKALQAMLGAQDLPLMALEDAGDFLDRIDAAREAERAAKRETTDSRANDPETASDTLAEGPGSVQS